MQLDLSSHIVRLRLAGTISAEVNAACIAKFKEPPRTHLGASIIGHPCSAYGWNVFRWLRPETHSGQMYRLFNRGHKEEARFVDWLTWTGWEIRELDPSTGKQFRINGCNGHFGGSLDGLGKAPESYALGSNSILVIEFKTHGENSFTKLAGKSARWGAPRQGGEGVIRSKPQHFRQMSCYGRAYGIRFGLYCAVNKNTDELYFEIVQLDWSLADDMFRKADMIVSSQVRPAKIAQTATYGDCKICDYLGSCHKGEPPAKNCRSCKNARPIENAQWWCDLHSSEANAAIPADVIAIGCPSYSPIV